MQSTLNSINAHIIFISIPGYIGPAEHDVMDRAAEQATSFVRITDNTYLPILNYKHHYPKLIMPTWNNTQWKDQPSNKLLRIKQFPQSQTSIIIFSHYYK